MKKFNPLLCCILLWYTPLSDALDAPVVQLSMSGLQVTLTWNGVTGAAGYTLHYAPYPQAQPIDNIDMGVQQRLAVMLPVGAAYYTAVTAYDAAKQASAYSNIEHFVLNDPAMNTQTLEKMLIVLSAPSVHDDYYREFFDKIIDFDVRFAQAIMGKDDVVVLADKDTLPYFKGRLPDEVLLEAEVADIWIRDFGTVHPSKMVKFAYDRPSQEAFIDQSFRAFLAENNLQVATDPLKVDGGNVVDNNHGRAVLTDKVLERNPQLTENQVIDKLKQALGATDIALIPMDEPHLGHADGMVMFVDDNTLVMNDYQGDPDFKANVRAELQHGLPNVDIHEIAGVGYGEAFGNYASACGIYVNSVVTNHYIYMPTFGDNAKDAAALQTVRSLTHKTVVPVDASEVCFLGGNTRCLSWQLTGEHAQQLLEAARKY